MRLSDSKVELISRGNKVVYQDGERVVKVFNTEKPAADVFNEALNIARVNGSGVRSCEVLEVSRVEEGDHKGSWAIANRYIPGTTLRQLMDDDKANEDKYLAMFVDLQTEIHEAEAPLLNRQKDKLARMIGSCKQIDPTTRYDLQMRVDGMHSGTSICHGDFVPSNVIVCDEDDQLYLVDWAHVTAGIAEVDAATTYLLLKRRDDDLAEKYLDLYSTKTDTPKQLIHYWLPVVAAAELARGRKENEEFLLSWINVGDYE